MVRLQRRKPAAMSPKVRMIAGGVLCVLGVSLVLGLAYVLGTAKPGSATEGIDIEIGFVRRLGWPLASGCTVPAVLVLGGLQFVFSAFFLHELIGFVGAKANSSPSVPSPARVAESSSNGDGQSVGESEVLVQPNDRVQSSFRALTHLLKSLQWLWGLTALVAFVWLVLYDVVKRQVFGEAVGAVAGFLTLMYTIFGAMVMHKKVIVPWWTRINAQASIGSWLREPLRPAVVAGMRMDREAKMAESRPMRQKLDRLIQRRASVRREAAKEARVSTSAGDGMTSPALLRDQLDELEASLTPASRSLPSTSAVQKLRETVLDRCTAAQEAKEKSFAALLFELDVAVDALAQEYNALIAVSDNIYTEDTCARAHSDSSALPFWSVAQNMKRKPGNEAARIAAVTGVPYCGWPEDSSNTDPTLAMASTEENMSRTPDGKLIGGPLLITNLARPCSFVLTPSCCRCSDRTARTPPPRPA
ncbi:hypothetical protein FVE85_9504 [Porphyridium purpureum]|uniref:Uncharacterized protein n=1 Tax=Porphyridium purpureum TaxID=35688 RepID=A0A5J4YIJ9_PORPP|nr:hypothetical protein FVE85_9504 [Porphyridium purpureum]|eukprot:POR2544..scf261_15